MVLAVLAAVITIPLVLMLVTCLLERVESVLVPEGERVVRATTPAESPRHLSLVPAADLDAVDPDFDPEATAQLRRVS